jgi:hypothetical protein
VNSGRTPLLVGLDRRVFEFLEEGRSEGRPVFKLRLYRLLLTLVSQHSEQAAGGYGGGKEALCPWHK